VGFIGDHRGMVALGVGVFRHDEHTLRAELDTKTASLAPFFDDANDAMGYLDAITI
jgi:hypothetical protein